MEFSPKQAAINELLRVEQDCECSYKAHCNVEDFWSKMHMIFGIGVTGLTAGASIVAAQHEAAFSVALGGVAAFLSAINTFWKADRQAAAHKVAAVQLQAIRNKARCLRTMKADILNEGKFVAKVIDLSGRRDELNGLSPTIPGWAFTRVRNDGANDPGKYRSDPIS